MGCLKLTYSEENNAEIWQVWVNGNPSKQHKGATVAQNGGDNLSGEIMTGALLLSGGLLADDVTGIGVADDVAIPFVLAAGAIAAGSVWLYENMDNPFPGPWTVDRPNNYIPAPLNGPNNKNYFPRGNGNDFIKYMIRLGGGAALGKKLYDGFNPKVPLVPQDNTRVVVRPALPYTILTPGP